MAGQWPTTPPEQNPFGSAPGGRPGPPPAPPSSGSRVLIIVLSIIGAIVVLGFGGCVACGVILGGAVDKGVKEVNRQLRDVQNRNAITDAQAQAVEVGAKRAEIIARFGPPATGSITRPELGRDCISYHVRDGTIGSQWRFCFRRGRLETKTKT
jgi:hypothetical protein